MKNLINVDCPLCRENNFEILYPSTLTPHDFRPEAIKEDLKNTLGNYKKHSRIVKCNNCGFVYTNPMENINVLLKGYKEVEDKEYLKTEKFRKILSQQHLQNIQKYVANGNLLDIGCFAGYFLELAQEKGFSGYGIEPSGWAGKIAKKRNVRIISKNIELVKLSNNYFDAVTMWDVIEHLTEPRKIITKCYKSLKKGGIIAMGTPDIESWVAKILRTNNPYILRMHISFFSPKTLGRMMEEEGFKVLNVYYYGRTFPINYILNIVKTDMKLFSNFKKMVKQHPSIADRQIHLNLRDSFTIIGRK